MKITIFGLLIIDFILLITLIIMHRKLQASYKQQEIMFIIPILTKENPQILNVAFELIKKGELDEIHSILTFALKEKDSTVEEFKRKYKKKFKKKK